jgi:D-beta-D-heptose 7-phosphate kinase/D-beta-D-heptose 1-phosphate adenosyltransferase
VVDVSGAGDTVVATVAAALAVGSDRPAAAALANVAAGVVVQKSGTAVVHPEDIVAALHETEMRASDAKIKPVTTAVRIAEGWRRAGKRVGFTNGTFDLLHPGHLASIRQARAACDRLVIGLNSDASVKRYKGPARPIQGEAARALVLASLEQVDLVVVFDDDTPERLIRALRPDVLVKGAQYRVDQVVGADLVRSWGGRVILAEMVDGESTTETVARMARR